MQRPSSDDGLLRAAENVTEWARYKIARGTNVCFTALRCAGITSTPYFKRAHSLGALHSTGQLGAADGVIHTGGHTRRRQTPARAEAECI